MCHDFSLTDNEVSRSWLLGGRRALRIIRRISRRTGKIGDCWLAVLADSVPPFPENSWPIYARYHNFWYLDKVVKVICCVCEYEASREKFKDELRNCFGIKNNSDDILADFGQPLSEFWTNAKKNLVNIRHIHPS